MQVLATAYVYYVNQGRGMRVYTNLSFEEIDKIEEKIEKMVCVKCKIEPIDKDCSSCELFLDLRDKHLGL